MRRWALLLGLMVATAVGGLAIWHQTNRVQFIQTLCEAGLPNLSRPPEVEADLLGCAVLGPTQTVTGFAEFGFELHRLTLGDSYEMENGRVTNARAWLSGTDGVLDRGWRPLMEKGNDEGCFTRVAKVTAQGWMTISSGAFGHIGIEEPREFFAYRIISSRPASASELAVLGQRNGSICPTNGQLASTPAAA